MANAFNLFISTNKVRMWPNGPPPIVFGTFGPSNSQNQNISASFVEGMGLNNELRLPDTNKFDGDPKKFKELMSQMLLHFWAKPETFCSEHNKIAFIGAQIIGTASTWFGKLILGNSSALNKFELFSSLFAQNFSDPTFAVKAQTRLKKYLPDDLEGVVTACAKVENRIAELEATQFSGYNNYKSPSSQPSHYQNRSQNTPQDPDSIDIDSVVKRRSHIASYKN
ncbi:hypothetical protein BB560_003315 [Smittium megazygosporum]|uniref:DUF4939 domain-containing protein n=1 Tax=Smittium megazygosporum TaxID=133381 RepID=A0A2T9ZCC1_9FUNG|nr:hypothetical protein BB560_003315 [Smittium megazygosporum]